MCLEKEVKTKQYYLKEFTYFDGEYDITMNIVDLNPERNTIRVAINHTGKISVVEYDLLKDKNGNYYFQYGSLLKRIDYADFETVED